MALKIYSECLLIRWLFESLFTFSETAALTDIQQGKARQNFENNLLYNTVHLVSLWLVKSSRRRRAPHSGTAVSPSSGETFWNWLCSRRRSMLRPLTKMPLMRGWLHYWGIIHTLGEKLQGVQAGLGPWVGWLCLFCVGWWEIGRTGWTSGQNKDFLGHPALTGSRAILGIQLCWWMKCKSSSMTFSWIFKIIPF